MSGYYLRAPSFRTAKVTLTPDSDGIFSLNMDHNTLYTITGTPALTALTLLPTTGLQYCGVDFVTGATPPTFTTSGTIVWTGADCSSGDFTPAASKSYRVSVEAWYGSYVATVQEVPEAN